MINFNFLNALKTAYGEKIQDISSQVLQAASENVLDDALSIDASNPKAEANRPGIAVRGTTSNTPLGGFKVAAREVYWHSENNLTVVLTGVDLNNKSQQWIRSYVDGSWESVWTSFDEKVNSILKSGNYIGRGSSLGSAADINNYYGSGVAGFYYVSSLATNSPPFSEMTNTELDSEYHYMLEIIPADFNYTIQRATLSVKDETITCTRARMMILNTDNMSETMQWTDWHRESYEFSTGGSNGTIKVTLPDGTDQDVPVAGLGTAAYEPFSTFVKNNQYNLAIGTDNFCKCLMTKEEYDINGDSTQIGEFLVCGSHNVVNGGAYSTFKDGLIVGNNNILRYPTTSGYGDRRNTREFEVWCFNLLGHHLTAGGTSGTGGGGNILMIGHYNKCQIGINSVYGTSGVAFLVGNGTPDTRADAFRIDYDGSIISDGAYSSVGADYAEYIEWKDKNEQQEDRVGKFVTLDGKYISLANAGDFIVGVISASPSVIGNGDIAWQKKYLTDDFGRRLKEIVEPLSEDDENTYESWVVNPDYNPELEYLSRESRPEWDAVGMLGFIRVYDDGTCEENGYCKAADGGIATKADVGDDSFLTPIFRVTQRISENIIEIFLR